MDIQEKRKNVTEYNVNYELNQAFTAGWLIARYEEQLSKIPCRVTLDHSGITCFPDDRAQTVTCLQTFGGKWAKAPEEYAKDKIRYSQPLPNPFETDWKIIISTCPPPACCSIVEVEELVPASVRKVKKMICPTEIKDEADETAPVADTGVPGVESEAASV